MRRPRFALLLVLGMLSAALPLAAAAPALAAPVVVASDLTGSAPVNLVSFTDDPAIPFTSPADGFSVYQRGVSASIPFDLLDDSLFTFPGDTQGIIDDNDLDPFFGITDTNNGDTVGAAVVASWVFDISGASDLSISIDLGAMGDFEAASDSFDFAYSIDGGGSMPLWSLTTDEDSSRSYTLAGGAVVELNDPLNLGATQLSNVLQTVSAPIVGTGTELTFNVTANTNGSGEAVVFNSIVISTDDGAIAPPTPGDLVITEVMQNPSAVFDSNGEWFEIENVSASPIDLDGWTIADKDFDSHVIAGSVVVSPGGRVVLGRNSDASTNGGVSVDYQYSGISLANGADELILVAPDTTEFDRIEWDGGPVWPDPNGASMSLDPGLIDTTSNSDGANWCEGSTAYGDGDLGTPGAENDSCEPPAPSFALIHEIQGSGSAVAISGPVITLGVVTSLFERDDVLDGFFIQTPDDLVDSDPLTSEGILVHCRGNCPVVATGDLVTVTGSAGEYFGMSQIDMTSGTAVIDSSGNALPTATAVDLPAPASTQAEETFEHAEGMIATFSDTLVVSEYFQLARFGQIVLTESSRPYQFTHTDAPSVTGYADFLDDLGKRRIILDDDNNDNNDAISDGPDEAYYYPGGGLSLTNKFRGGDTISDLTGVLHWSWAGSSGTDAWRIRPIVGESYGFTPVNAAPAAPSDVGGSIQVASFNVLNYFTTIDLGPGACGPSGTLGCRGAHSTDELDRQRAKTAIAMLQLDAEVLGLVELENDGDDSSIADLVGALNASAGAGTYDYVPTGFIGGDAIKVGFIYKPALVSLDGAFALLDSSVDPTFNDSKNRPVLIQTFVENETGEKFTVAVNHLKSKGSSCVDVGDPGMNDGQANCSGTRTAAATALANHLATDPTGSGDSDFLIIGDLNAYAMEDPITALTSVGYTDLIAAFGGPTAYSYVFDGQLGYLDHALANSSLLPRITGVTEWHINADEVNLFDYNDDVRDPGEASFERESGVLPIYAEDALRSSDHDPLLIGLNLADPQGDKQDMVAALSALMPTEDRNTNRRLSAAIGFIEDSLTGSWWTSDQTITTKKVFDFERRAISQLKLVAASGVPEAGVAQSAIDVLVNADRQLAQIELIAAMTRGGDSSKISDAQSAMADAAEYTALGLYADAVNSYKSAWDSAKKA